MGGIGNAQQRMTDQGALRSDTISGDQFGSFSSGIRFAPDGLACGEVSHFLFMIRPVRESGPYWSGIEVARLDR